MITSTGEVTSGHYSIESYTNFGMVFKTKELAERAAIEIRRVNRIRALAYQLDPDYVDTFDYTRLCKTNFNDSSMIFNNNGEWKHASSSITRNQGTTAMRKETAIKLCDILNSGNYPL